jgi:type II secretory pathway pseudopilin PulG
VPSSPFRSDGCQAGYALLAMLVLVALLLISLTAALPRLYQEAQRQREKEAIFRGEQYARAIYLYHRTVGQFPTSVKQLLLTNGVRYLRQAYPDPLSPNGKWRFIHAAATGMLLDSENQNALSLTQPGDQPASQPGAQSASQPSFNSPGETGETAKKKKPVSDCQGNANSSSGQQAQTQTGTLLGAFIAGVAPCSDVPSIQVWDHKRHYDHWEFLGTSYTPYALSTAQPSQPASPFQNSQPGQNQPSGPSQPSASPFNAASPTTGGGPP